MEETDILSNLNIYGWIFILSLGAIIGGWLGSRIVVIFAGGKMILKKDKKDPKYNPSFGIERDYLGRGVNSKFTNEAHNRGGATFLGRFFRIIFWTGLVVLIIFGTSIYFFAPADFTLNNPI